MVRKVDCFEDVFAKVNQRLVRYPCPLAEQHNCSTTFSSKANADRHKFKHSGIRYPCPLAEQYQCTRTFAQPPKKRHAESHTRYPCPFRNQYQCALTFSTKWAAHNHAAQHFGIRHPYPVADQYRCSQTFADVASARLHAQSQHLVIRFPCPLADRFPFPPPPPNFPITKASSVTCWISASQNSISLPFSGSIELLQILHSEALCTRARWMEGRRRRLSLSFGRTI